MPYMLDDPAQMTPAERRRHLAFRAIVEHRLDQQLEHAGPLLGLQGISHRVEGSHGGGQLVLVDGLDAVIPGTNILQ